MKAQPQLQPQPCVLQASVGVDESTYLPMLAVAQRRGDWREAIELLVHAKEIKCETGGQSYNLTLTACANACEERACRQLLEQMVAKGLALSQETQGALHAAGGARPERCRVGRRGPIQENGVRVEGRCEADPIGGDGPDLNGVAGCGW